jgi:DNA-directed RNA polymerase subunit RPC12/RpoP
LTVRVTCTSCGHTAEVKVPHGRGGRTFRCSVCKGEGEVQLKGSAAAPPPDGYVCAGCAVELTPKTLRQISGQIYCVECASKVETGQKRFTKKAWNDFKGATSWKKH